MLKITTYIHNFVHGDFHLTVITCLCVFLFVQPFLFIVFFKWYQFFCQILQLVFLYSFIEAFIYLQINRVFLYVILLQPIDLVFIYPFKSVIFIHSSKRNVPSSISHKQSTIKLMISIVYMLTSCNQQNHCRILYYYLSQLQRYLRYFLRSHLTIS